MYFKPIIATIILCFSIPAWAISLEEEIKLGTQEHIKIVRQFGVVTPYSGAYSKSI